MVRYELAHGSAPPCRDGKPCQFRYGTEVVKVVRRPLGQRPFGGKVLYGHPPVIAMGGERLEVLQHAALARTQGSPLVTVDSCAGLVGFTAVDPYRVLHVHVGQIVAQELEGREVVLLAFDEQVAQVVDYSHVPRIQAVQQPEC